jgi:polysaccharide pyruvyl transferase WcaK-like protein
MALKANWYKFIMALFIRRMMASKPFLTVALLWHSLSSDNLGVGALTESQLAICKSAAAKAGLDVKFVVFGTKGGRDYTSDKYDVRTGGKVSIKQILAGNSRFVSDIRSCDVVLDIGEGDSFTDIYGLKRFLFLIVSKIVVILNGKPLVLSPQTIGPFERWYTRWIASWIMRRCEYVYARDALSLDYLKTCGVLRNVDEAIDVAFRLEYEKPEISNDDVVRIGLNVSGLLFSGGYSGDNQFGLTLDYPTLTRALLSEWTAMPKVEVWLVPHVMPDDLPNDDDRSAIDILLREFPLARRAPDFRRPSDAKSFISGLDFFTGARMHACIAAFSSGVPVVPLAYSRKFNGLFSSVGYQHVADGRAQDTESALATIRSGFQNRSKLARDVAEGNLIAIQKLAGYELYLVGLFRKAMSLPAEHSASAVGDFIGR